MAGTFQATIGGKSTPLIDLSANDTDTDSMIVTYNTEVANTARQMLEKQRPEKPYVTRDLLDLCDEMRDLQKRRYVEEAKKNNSSPEGSEVPEESERGLDRYPVQRDSYLPEQNNGEKAFQQEENLTSRKQGRSTTMQPKSGKCLTEEQAILSRWTEYRLELCNCERYGETQFWTAVSTQKTIYSQFFMRKLRSQ